jgi:diguanylate cyclase (GGDEF)-like protein/PAS domain S-box-containing protein
MEISQLRASQKRAAENAARFQLAMESAPMGMASVSMDRIFLEVNDALCQMIGRSRKDLVGRPLSDIVHSADNDADMSVRANVLAGREKWAKSEKRLVRADGSEVWVNHLVGLVTGDNDEPISYVSQFVDITESRAKQFKLENLADTDPLTGLPHRGALDKTLGAWFPDAEGGQVAVLFLDLDDFKNLNDTHGHQAGDRALIAVAQRLQATVRKSDTLVRFGGDEFVLITRTPPAEIAELCRRLISSLADPVHLQDVSVKMTMSIGAAASRPGDDYDSVLWRADANVYQAKAAGGNHFVIDPA